MCGFLLGLLGQSERVFIGDVCLIHVFYLNVTCLELVNVGTCDVPGLPRMCVCVSLSCRTLGLIIVCCQ